LGSLRFLRAFLSRPLVNLRPPPTTPSYFEVIIRLRRRRRCEAALVGERPVWLPPLAPSSLNGRTSGLYPGKSQRWALRNIMSSQVPVSYPRIDCRQETIFIFSNRAETQFKMYQEECQHPL
jgi:hypothetical protein